VVNQPSKGSLRVSVRCLPTSLPTSLPIAPVREVMAEHGIENLTINWTAEYLAWVFALHGMVLLWSGAVRPGLSFEPRSPARDVLGVGIVAVALLAWPLIGMALGRPGSQADGGLLTALSALPPTGLPSRPVAQPALTR